MGSYKQYKILPNTYDAESRVIEEMYYLTHTRVTYESNPETQ